MGIFDRHGLTVLVLLLPCLYIDAAQDWRGKYGQKENNVWTHSELKTANAVNDQGCCLEPCMIGPFCNESVAEYSPQFQSGYTYANINDGQGTTIDYNSTTYPIPKRCHCENIVYSILSIKNDIEVDEDANHDLFSIDPSTGEITVKKDVNPMDMYSLVVEARNKLTNRSTQTKLTLARRVQISDPLNEFSPLRYNGYDSPHHRQKRAITGNDITFNLTKLTAVTSMKVGTKIEFNLDIEFQGTGNMEMLVELFAPDNDTTVMIICCVTVNTVGLLTPQNPSPHQVVYDSKTGNNITSPDRAIIDFGTVTAQSVGDRITITYCAVMIQNAGTVNGDSYYVSSGVEYDSGNYLWVGQASFLADYDMTTTILPTFFVDAPSSIELGSSKKIDVQMQLPYPHSSYNFKVYTPTDVPGTMSVCALQYMNRGTNFECGNDFSSISAVLSTDPVGPGNYLGALDMGLKLNSESRSTDPLTDASNISLSFVAHLYPDITAGSTASLALCLEVDSSTLWVANLSMIVDPKTSLPVNPAISNVVNDIPSGASIGQSFSITYDLIVTPHSTEGAGSHYVIEVLAPFTTEALFSVCSLEIVSVGNDLPCLNKDDLVPVYSSRVTDGSVPDSGRLDIGYINNVNIHQGVGDDTIQIKAVLSPIEGKATTTSSPYNVYFGVTVESANVIMHDESINVNFEATSIAVTNETTPSMSMSPSDSELEVWYNGVQRIDLNILTVPNITYPVMELEFLMPTDVASPFIHVCRVQVESKGRNLPCLTPEWTNKIVQYISQFSTDEIDRAKLDLQRLCNSGEYPDVNDNSAIFSIYLKILNSESPADNVVNIVSAGLMYSTTKLWIGQLSLTSRTTAVKALASPTGSLHHYFQQNSTAGSISIGESAQYSLLLKIPPNEYIDLKVLVTSSGIGLDICTVRVFAAGDKLPCTVDELTTKTYTYHSDNGRLATLLDIGPTKRYDSDNITVNDFFDADSIIIEVIVTGTLAGSHTFDVEVFVDTAQNTANSIKYTGNAVTVTSSTFTQAYADVVNVTLSVGEFITNDSITTDIAIGEIKKVLLTASIPEGSKYKLDFAIIIPSTYVGKLDILDAAVMSIGGNLPCIDADKVTPQFNSAGGVYSDTVKFDVGYTSCNWPVKPGVTTENQIVFEAYVRAMPNGLVSAGETVEVTGTMNVNDGSPISVTGLPLSVVATDTFVDKVQYPDSITNDTLVELDQAATVTLTPGQNLTIGVTITIPVQSQSRFYFDTKMPVDADSACLIIRDMRVIGSLGRNVLFMGPSLTKSLEFTPAYNSSLINGQMDYGLFDLGLITNTGLSYRLKSNATDDDKFKLEVDVQMVDCGSSADGQSYVLSFGNKITNVIFIYEQTVQMSRDTTELPDIVFDTIHTVLSNNNLNIDGIVFHSNLSTAEGLNTSIFVYLPSYQIAPTTLVSNSLSSKCSVNSVEPNVLEIFCPNFYFCDILTFRAVVTVNSTIDLPQGFSAADSTALAEVGTDFNIRYNTYDSMDWYSYYTSSSHYMEYSVSAGLGTGCISALGMESGAIQNCQILGSTNSLTSHTYGRLNGGSVWRPYVRDGAIAQERYLQIYFGNTVLVKQVAVQQSGVVMATSIWVAHSHDGNAWFGKEEISLGVALETVLIPGAQEAEYIRIFVGNTTTDAKPDVSLRFEVYGCTVSGTMTASDICTAAPTQTVESEFYPRSFITGTSGEVYVCDRSLSAAFTGGCQSSADGNTWTELDGQLASLVGMETSLNYIFGFAQNRETILRSEDNGVSWQAVERAELDQRKLSGSWKNAVDVPESTVSTLIQSSPSLLYTQSTWGAYDGMFLSGSLFKFHLRWNVPIWKPKIKVDFYWPLVRGG